MDVQDSYRPNEWQEDFHADSSRHKACVGGLGSGKTLAGCQELKQLALEHPGSRWVIGRKLLPSLRDSIWRDFLQVLPSEIIEDYNKTQLNIVLKNGSEFWGRPLYDPEVFKSYQIAGFLMEEANEVTKEIYDRLKDRMRQKLPNGNRPRYQSIILLNPTEDDHWIPELFLKTRPKNHRLFQSSTLQNASNLPPHYIEELKSIYSVDMQQRLIYGNFGKVHKGRPVYPQFSHEVHMREVQYDPKLPLVRGWDFGYNHPACVWLQMKDGQVRVLAEKMGKKVYLPKFIEECREVQESIFGKEPGVYAPILDFCDPRGADESDKGKTSIQILNDHNIYPVYRRTFIEEGLAAVNHLMDTRNPQTGQANFLIHKRCKLISEGLRGGYHREEGGEQPEKDGYYEHLQDAMRYAIIFLVMRLKARKLTQAQSNLNVIIDPRTGRRIEFARN